MVFIIGWIYYVFSEASKEGSEVWVERQDPTTGFAYNVNTVSGERSNHRPAIVHHETGVLEDEYAGGSVVA